MYNIPTISVSYMNLFRTTALFFSMGNLGCGMGECGKGGKELVTVGKNDIFF